MRRNRDTDEKEIDTTPLTYTIVDNGQNVYTFDGDINAGNLVVSYAKNDGYNAAKVTPSKAIQVTYLKVVVKGEGELIVKPNDDWQLESNKVLTAEGTVYEWVFQSPTDLTSVLFMVAPGNNTAVGTFTIVSFEATLA